MSQFQFQILTEQEANAILQASLNLLQTNGVKIYADQALALLRQAGCEVSGNLVRIPGELVLKSVKTAPGSIEMYNRDGEPAMKLTGTNSYFGPGVTCPFFYDPYTLERKPATKQNVRDVATVADALENVDFLMSLCMIGDRTPRLADIQEVHALIQSSVKPICTWAFNRENLEVIIRMAQIAVGGREQLREKPYIVVYTEPTTPFVHTKEAIEKLMLLAEADIPCVYSPGMTLGGTAPVTIAGALTVGIADVLTGVVISQLVNPGAPIIVGSNAGVLDMRSLQAPYGSPEMCLIDAAGTQILRSLGLVTFGLAGATDSKALDMQAGMEAMMQIIFSIGSGANLVHDLGMMDLGMTGSLHYLVACDEIVGMARHLKRGVIVDDGRLAQDVIREVGIGGNFVAEEHTVEFMREDMFVPELGPRVQYSFWEQGGKRTLGDHACEKAVRILQSHACKPLDGDKKRQLDAIVDELERTYE